MKTMVISIDGMRPDALKDIPQVQELKKRASYTMNGTTVFPSVTLPCHVSLFHSVDPSRHGTTTNTYMPQVRPVNGLCEVLAKAGKKCAVFYDWEQLRDLTRPGSLSFSYFCKGREIGYDKSNDKITETVIEYLNQNDVDFTFVYMGHTDMAGHNFGWMSEQYMNAMQHCWKNVERILNGLKGEYTIIITTDHGGHDRTHGTDLPEDMTIPMFVFGKDYEAGVEIKDANIKDVAPTVAKILGVESDEEWEGKEI